MRECPETVKVVSDKGPDGFVIMNLTDFDPETMQRFDGEVPAPAEPKTEEPSAPTGRRPGRG